MTALPATTVPRTVLDVLARASIARDAVAIIGGAALTSLAAQVVIPLWPVPITGQTFAVLFVGATLGTVRGSLSMLLYVAVGVHRLPIFAAGGHGSPLGSPSGGFLIGSSSRQQLPDGSPNVDGTEGFFRGSWRSPQVPRRST